MQVDRRTHCLAGGRCCRRSAPAWRDGATVASASWYDRAIVIDALGGIGDPYAPDGVAPHGDRGWAETLATGVTVVRDTVFPVGNVADPWGDYQKVIVNKQELLGANPDRLLLIRSAADILEGQAREEVRPRSSARRTPRWSGPNSIGWRR